VEESRSTPVGTIEAIAVVEGEDDTNREPPNAWVDMPPYLTGKDLR
jgi:hypothetical protein